MTIKEIQARVGSLAGYGWYAFLMLCWYFADNVYTSARPLFPGNALEPFLDWGVKIVCLPILLAGVFGGIHEQQQSQENWDLSGFFAGIKKHSLRLAGANLLGLSSYLLVSVVVFLVSGARDANFTDQPLLLGLISIPYAVITLFWFSGLVVERKLFGGLFLSLKTLLLNPAALLIGLAWGGLAFADTVYFELAGAPIPLAVNGLRAAVLAVLRTLAIVYLLAIYKQARGISPNASTEERPSLTARTPGEGVVNAGFGFACASFLPLLHLVALALGLVAIFQKKRFGLRSALACGLGGFFTLFYALLLAGWLANGAIASPQPGYGFLSLVEPDLKPQARLLDQGSFAEARDQLEQSAALNADHSWAVDCALALARSETGDTSGALEAFWAAAGKNPERSEFYYYYGVALLENDQEARAAEQFQLALAREPKLAQAERYQTLLSSKYEPPEGVTALLFVIFLIISFTFHEYGHAFVAWKLGDHTAEQEGRLTLNPLRHLDPFGSVILPALMLFQNSGMVFGWAKPVPVDPRNFKDPRRDHMRVSFAGPAVNLLLAMACFLILAAILFFVRLFWPETISINFAVPYAPVSIVGPSFARWLTVIVVFLKQAFYFSLMLGCLNLLPIPPLDGSWILSGLLPETFGLFFERIRGFSFMIFMLLAMSPVLGYILAIPLGLAFGGFQVLVSALGLG